MPPRRFWIRVGSVIVAEGIEWNRPRNYPGSISVHWPGRPTPVTMFNSVEDLTRNMADWGWGKEARVQWIDEQSASHGVAECAGVGE